MKYAIQCTDSKSGKVGDFGYTERASDGKFIACTPVFSNLAAFYRYCKEKGIELDHTAKSTWPFLKKA